MVVDNLGGAASQAAVITSRLNNIDQLIASILARLDALEKKEKENAKQSNETTERPRVIGGRRNGE